MANIDGRGRIVFGNTLDERGLRIFGSINERGHFIMGRAFTFVFVETLHISDSTVRTFTRDLMEPLQIADSTLRSINKTLTEQVHITVNKQVTFARNIVQNVLLNASMRLELTRTFTEQITISDLISKGLMFVEHMHVSVDVNKTLTRIFRENISIISTFIPQIVPFVMRLWNTKLDGARKHSSLYSTNLVSKARSLINHSGATQVPKNTQTKELHKHTDVSLEDGRELR
jgi:hypothetical protein